MAENPSPTMELFSIFSIAFSHSWDWGIRIHSEKHHGRTPCLILGISTFSPLLLSRLSRLHRSNISWGFFWKFGPARLCFVPLPTTVLADVGTLEFSMFLGAYLTGKLLPGGIFGLILLHSLVNLASLLLATSALVSDII